MGRTAIMLCLALALILTAPLSACGKKGDPEAPSGEPNNYPKVYPTE